MPEKHTQKLPDITTKDSCKTIPLSHDGGLEIILLSERDMVGGEAILREKILPCREKLYIIISLLVIAQGPATIDLFTWSKCYTHSDYHLFVEYHCPCNFTT